jgi:ABC-type sugar transport system ATPase subunit
MSVRDNLAYGLRVRRSDRADIAERVAATAASLGLEALLDRRPAQLSGGQRQRVALGRAIVRQPRAFLLDEPLSNLDPALRAQARTELRRLHQSLGSTIVYVTHDQEEAMTLGGRIAVMRDGVLEQVAPPLDVYERPANAFVARFIGAPAMNLFPPATAGLDSTAGAMAGIRPQDILLREDGPLRATVDLVEPRGHDAVVHLRVDDAAATSLMALTPIPPPAGSVVGVVLPRERLHLFDEAGVRVKG